MQFDISESIDILSRTPGVLTVLLSGLPHSWLHTNEGPNTWSPYDIVGHLIHGEQTDWIPRAKMILDESFNEAFPPFDRFAQFENSKGKTMEQLLSEFTVLRAANITEFQSLNIRPEQLDKTGIHPDPSIGTVTLKQLLATWTAHDLSHINQISRVMAKNYKEEVGPWARYISIFG